ncbi:MAG TPA: hypothetical protein VKA67_11255 [Verrucomicrobiae bacterium]|nr:hypothetical protein [Verrucomicrobiae bacterium]
MPAISSNRIEGVEVDKSRVATLVFGKPALRGRDEEEVRGYRDALKRSTFRVADLQAECPGVFDPSDSGPVAKGRANQSAGHWPEREMGKTGKPGHKPGIKPGIEKRIATLKPREELSL